MKDQDYISFQRTGLAEALGLLRSAQVAEDSLPPVSLAVSIILVNYNGWGDLEHCLSSLEADPIQNGEIIVVDNCSNDDSPQRIAGRFPTVRLIRSALNLGFGAGNNLGAILARGQTLVFLNPDTVVTPGWLPPLLQTLDENPQVGMVTPRILLMSEPGRINTCGNDVHLSGLALCRGMGQAAAVDAEDAERIEAVAAISGAAFAIRSELFQAVGGFDETFFLYMEDTDLSLRAQLAGFTCAYVPGSTVYHDYALSFGPMKIFYQERNRYLMLLKCLRRRTLFVLFPALLLAEIVTWGYVLWRDRAGGRNKLFAYTWVLFWWQQIQQKRAQTQLLRRIRDRALLRQMSARIDFGQAGGGWVVRLSHLVFDPLFILLHGLALALVWW